MPAKSKKQERFMQAVANNPEFAKKAGVPQNVGKEFTMKKYQAGGMTSSPRPKMRPEDLMEGRKKRGGAPKKSMRPKARPDTMVTPEEAGAIERGNRAAKRRADEAMPMMKAGGKVRGCGMARGGAVRQCKMVKMKGS